LKYAAIAMVGAACAISGARALSTSAGSPRAMAVQPVAAAAPAVGQPASISKSADGHYWAEASVNGRQVRFLVDTGASAVALTPEDARRLGFEPAGLDYAFDVSTANGKARAARIQLASVSVAGARVSDVEAFVIERGLDTSLLGMTYLGRLSRFEASRNALILRP
jgi:aspartyl protease family protein